MKTTIFALSLLGLFATIPALGGEILSPACKGRVAYDLGLKGYDMRAIRYVGVERGDCDGETCTPDVMRLLVTARAADGRNYYLAVNANPQFRGEDTVSSCRVSGFRRLADAR